MSDIIESPEAPKQPFHGGPGSGRLKGAKNKFSRESIDKMRKLGIDPLEEMVALHKKFVKEIKRQEELQEKKDKGLTVVGGPQYSAMAHAALLTADEKLLSGLIPYRYAKIPVEVALNDNTLPPIMISLTKEGEIYEIDPSENVDIGDDSNLALKGDDE